jgi:hypothetical protein
MSNNPEYLIMSASGPVDTGLKEFYCNNKFVMVSTLYMVQKPDKTVLLHSTVFERNDYQNFSAFSEHNIVWHYTGSYTTMKATFTKKRMIKFLEILVINDLQL